MCMFRVFAVFNMQEYSSLRFVRGVNSTKFPFFACVELGRQIVRAYYLGRMSAPRSISTAASIIAYLRIRTFFWSTQRALRRAAVVERDSRPPWLCLDPPCSRGSASWLFRLLNGSVLLQNRRNFNLCSIYFCSYTILVMVKSSSSKEFGVPEKYCAPLPWHASLTHRMPV